jgi:hypothetical protein
LLEAYRHDKQGTLSDPLDHLSIAERAGSPPPDWDRLVADLADVPPGNEHSTRHERSIEALLSAILYPDLTNPIVQAELHEGRKRVDITYTNVAQRGFFDWLAQHYPASHVFVECKNYSTDIGNPELDQLSSRFAPSRGQFGIMVCRTFEKKDLFVMRCRDTAHDGRGYIIALDDGDLSHLAFLRKQSGYFELQDYLKAKFNALIM